MSEFLIYNGKVAVLLAVFYLFYRLLMEHETFHRLNRAVLLLSVLAAFVLPLCEITLHETVVTVQPETVPSAIAEAHPPVNPVQGSGDKWVTVLTIICLAGMVTILSRTVWSIGRIIRFVNHCERHPQPDGTTIAVCEQNLAPFSWWNTIVLSRADFEAHDPDLLAHERAHIAGYHSVDILMMQFFVALQWFNPAIWLMARELRNVHEYEADAAVLAGNVDIHHYLSLLMERANVSNRYTLANGISQKTLKSRFQMMARRHSSPSRLLKILYVLPVIGCTLMLNARTVVETRYIQKLRTIKGTAEDQNRQPIAGVQVSVKGKEGNTLSDRNGEYKITAGTGDTIVWTYQGETELYQLKDTDNYVALVQDLPEAEQAAPTSEKVSVSGTIVDEQGEPIIGAVIKVHGQTLGTVSDYDGKFTFSVPQGSTLEVMYVGFGTEYIICQEDMSNLKVALIKDNSDQ